MVQTAPGIAFGVGTTGERVTSRLAVPSGGALVLVTDGLVERRHEDIDVGMGRVVAAARSKSESAAALLGQVVAALAPEGADDDVTVVTLRRL